MDDFWNRCLDELRISTPPDIFETWYSDLTAETDLDIGAITIYGGSSTKARNVQSAYGDTIQKLVNRLANKEMAIHWATRETPAPVSVSVERAPEPSIEERTGLLPNLTFENLVEGHANQLAVASALQVASTTNAIYNPLFIYGGVGLGKTHLMHAIGNRYLELNPKAKVRCVSAQQYIQEFLNAINQKAGSNNNDTAMREFEQRYRDLDLLLIDDIQNFAQRSGTQANFFQTFENMVPHGKKIVLTSDTYPNDLKDLQERLRSRLSQGLRVSVEPPEYEMRVQIVLQKAERSQLKLPLEVAEAIAANLKSNVRELEGAVQQVIAYSNFHGEEVTLEMAKMALRDIFRSSAQPVSVEEIQEIVAKHFNSTVADINGKSRKAEIVLVRSIAMYLAKELTTKSLPELGKLFGGRDHTTIIHSCKKIKAQRNTDENLRHVLHLLEQRIKN